MFYVFLFSQIRERITVIIATHSVPKISFRPILFNAFSTHVHVSKKNRRLIIAQVRCLPVPLDSFRIVARMAKALHESSPRAIVALHVSKERSREQKDGQE